MTYVSAPLRILAGGVEPFRYRMLVLYARFTSALFDLSFFFREDLDVKAAFVTASTAIDTLHMICMPLPSKRQMLGRRSRIPVSCAGCLVFIRPLFARVHEVTSAKWILDSTSLHLFEHEHEVWPCLAASQLGCTATSQVCTRWLGPRDSRASLGLRGQRLSLQCRREYSVGLVHVCGCCVRKLWFFVGLCTCSHVC
jgi:hypothetical protein